MKNPKKNNNVEIKSELPVIIESPHKNEFELKETYWEIKKKNLWEGFCVAWLDFWFVITIIVGFNLAIVLFLNPFKLVLQLYSIRQFLVGNISIMELGNSGIKVITIDENKDITINENEKTVL